MAISDRPTGKKFTQVYRELPERAEDSARFRTKLGGYIQRELAAHHQDLCSQFHFELAVEVPIELYYDFTSTINFIDLDAVLDSITVIYNYFIKTSKMYNTVHDTQRYLNIANEWAEFVGRLFREENLGWEIDEKCGVHYLVDKNFQIVKQATLEGLQSKRYTNIRSEYESAFNALNRHSEDKCKTEAVKSIFAATESLVKLMLPDERQLNKAVVEKKVKQLVLATYDGDDTAISAVSNAIDGFARLVDGMHYYRHGQGEENKVVDPPLGYTVYALNSSASFIRLLLEVDAKLNL